MQTESPKKYTGSETGIGASFTQIPLDDGATTPQNPPFFGEVHLVSITKDAGPATTATYRIVGGGPADVVYWTSAALPLDIASHQPGGYPIAYARVPIASPEGFKLEVLTDDGTNSTDLSAEVVIVVPR